MYRPQGSCKYYKEGCEHWTLHIRKALCILRSNTVLQGFYKPDSNYNISRWITYLCFTTIKYWRIKYLSIYRCFLLPFKVLHSATFFFFLSARMLSHWHAYFCCLDIDWVWFWSTCTQLVWRKKRRDCAKLMPPQIVWLHIRLLAISFNTLQCTDDEYFKLMPLRNPESLPLSNCAWPLNPGDQNSSHYPLPPAHGHFHPDINTLTECIGYISS